MNTSKRMTLLAISAMLVLAACGRNNEPNNDNNTDNNTANATTPNNMTTPNNATSNNTANMTANNTANMTANNTANMTSNNTNMGNENPVADPSADVSVEAGATQSYTISGLNPDQAYRITLVVDANITVSGGAGTFVDNDDNGAADAGASEEIALITSVNGDTQDGAKTVPAGSDDPANPSGVFPNDDGEITFVVTGVAAGTVHPVIYHNGGESTFLEIDGDGAPVETHIVAGALTVEGGGEVPVSDPADDTTIATGETQSYTFSGLNSEQAYRITLVVDANVNVTDGAGTFVDNDMNGAADAGASENVALITSVNGQGQDGAKTVPAGTDDPADPSGVFPSDSGEITIEVTGVGVGKVYPVLYHNGGASTFLEIDAGTPIETHLVGGGLTVEYAYAFATEGPEAFTRVDRKGMPAVATALISSKDAYNAADPADDANGDFVTEIVTSLNGLHAALDDDLLGLSLTPCTVVGDGSGTCVAQGAPLIVPDTLSIDTTGTAGFPNGRLLADPVMDVTLAVVLIDLTVHAADTLAGVPVNPTANDLEFKTDFPYLADPH